MKKNEELSIRKPERESLSRATSINRTNVKRFFDNLIKIYYRNAPIQPANIYNIDEIALTTVSDPTEIIAPRGKKLVEFVTLGERGQLITMIGGINAIGNHVPPYFGFPRINYKEFMIVGAPPQSDGTANPPGWSNSDIFLKCMQHFNKFVKPSKENPILFIFYNHESHIGPEVIDLARCRKDYFFDSCTSHQQPHATVRY